MIDRLFLPALTFVVLVATASAFAAEVVHSRAPQSIVQLERVVIIGQRELPATPVAQTGAQALPER